MARYAVNDEAVAYVRELIDKRQYVLRSEWGEVQPDAEAQNGYLERHDWAAYGRWHLGLTEGANDETKARSPCSMSQYLAGLGGTISGSAKIAGSLAQPSANFNVSGDRLSATALDDLDCRHSRRPRPEAFPIRSSRCHRPASAPAGLTLAASGRVDLAGADTNITINGRAPLALANRFLADRGTQLSGTVAIAVSISGSLKKPAVEGTVSTSGAQVVDPEANLRLATSRSTPPSTATPSRYATLPQPSEAVARSARQERFRWLATCLPTSALRSTMPAMPTAILSSRP